MKILVWGCSGRMMSFLKKVNFFDIDIDFTDSDAGKWGIEILPGKEIISVEKLETNQYEYCVIGSERYEKEIEETCYRYGFRKEQIIPTVYVVAQSVKWKKIFYLKEWMNRVESEKIKIIKNWYTNNDRLECIIKIQDSWDEYLDIKCIASWMSSKQLKIYDIVGDREHTYFVNSGEEINYKISDNNSIIKLVVEDSTYSVPWITFSLCKTDEKNGFENEKRYVNFRDALSNMQSFYFHDEDYLALRNFNADGTILDIGANYGQSMYAFYKLTKSKIVSVEPVPDLYSVLCLYKKTFDVEDRVKIINAGVADKEEALIWYEPEDKNYSGSFDKEFMESRKLNIAITEKVLDCKKIDDMFYDIDNLWFIKMDVEGLEYKAIVGGMQTILRHFPIMLLEENPHKSEIYDLLKEWYDIYYYNPDKNIFVKEKVSGINYWMIPKKEFRKVAVDNIAQLD